MTNALAITTVNDEARVLDTDLALSLGMLRPNMIRTNLIVPSRAELEGFGPLACVASKSRGQEFTSYYLNEEQALLVCILSRTDKAKEVRASVIRVFTAWRRGQLPAFVAPTSMKEALLLALAQCEQIEQLTTQAEVTRKAGGGN